MICAVAIEGDEDVAIAHQLNNPSTPVAVHHMCKTADVHESCRTLSTRVSLA